MMTSEQKWIRFTVYENGGKTHSITRTLLTFIAKRQFPTPHLSFQIVRYSANRDNRIMTEKGISFVENKYRDIIRKTRWPNNSFLPEFVKKSVGV